MHKEMFWRGVRRGGLAALFSGLLSAAMARDGVDRVSFAPSVTTEYSDSRAAIRVSELQGYVQKMLLVQKVEDVSAFVRQLVAPARSDQEKAWLVYRWVAGRVVYDVGASARLGPVSRRSIEHMLNNPRGACALYARLTHELFQLAGLDSRLVSGAVKTGGAGSRGSHAWNVVKLGGRWWTVDPTWGAGYLSDAGFVRQQNDLFFMIPAAWVALNYFDPADTVGAQQDMGISQAEFNRLPEGGIYVSALGFPARDVFRTAVKGEPLVETYALPEGAFKVLQAPLGRNLNRGAVHHFSLESSLYEEMVLVQGDDWTYLNRLQGRFDVDLRPKSGELLVMGRMRGKDEFEALLGYLAR